MTIRDIIDYVQADVNSRQFWNDERIINIINMVQYRMSVELKLVVEDFFKFSSTLDQRYLLPSNLMAIENLWYNSGGTKRIIKIVPKPSDVYGLESEPETNTSDNPYKAFIWTSSGRKELWMFPKFSTAGIDLWLWFYGTPARINSDNDVSPLPVETHIYIVEAVKNHIAQVDEQITKMEELALWKDLIAMCKQIDTVKNIVTRDSQFAKQGITVLNDFGLVDGSNNGISWD